MLDINIGYVCSESMTYESIIHGNKNTLTYASLEVLSLYIPNLVESDGLEKIARDLSAVEPTIPFSILAFFPEHQMKGFRRCNTIEMVKAYKKVQSTGLQNIRLGNLGVFIHNDEDRDYILANIYISAL